MCLLLTLFSVIAAIIVAKVIEYWLRKPYIDNITKDKYVFITGCDTGFGNELAKQLDNKGVHVIASCLTEKGRSDLDEVTSERVMTLILDVTDHESVIRAHEEVRKIIPHQSALWGVVNNAGIANNPGFLEWSRREDYEKVLAVNLFGAIDVTLTFLPLLKKSNGRLVNVASVAGRVASVHGGYCESKYAIEAFSDMVRKERRQFNYRFNVSVIEPGFFATAIASPENISRGGTFAWNRLSDEEKKEFPETLLRNYINTLVSLVGKMATRDITKVTDVMEHALFAKWPKTRYAVGWDAKYVWVPLSYCPAWIQDIISGGSRILK